jgi:acyl dehydratase
MKLFEDIVVGERHAFGRYEVHRDEVLAFARKFDPQPFHLDDNAAAQTHFGRLAASGWHSCAMTMAMIVENFERDQHASLGAAGIDELRWLKPVFPGDTLRCETEVLDKRVSTSRPEMGSVRTRMTVFNQDDVPVLSFISIALWRTRAGAG